MGCTVPLSKADTPLTDFRQQRRGRARRKRGQAELPAAPESDAAGATKPLGACADFRACAVAGQGRPASARPAGWEQAPLDGTRDLLLNNACFRGYHRGVFLLTLFQPCHRK